MKKKTRDHQDHGLFSVSNNEVSDATSLVGARSQRGRSVRRQLERGGGEPFTSRIDVATNGVRAAGRGPAVAGAIRFARGLHPEVSGDERLAGVGGRQQTETACWRVTPNLRITTRGGRLVAEDDVGADVGLTRGRVELDGGAGPAEQPAAPRERSTSALRSAFCRHAGLEARRARALACATRPRCSSPARARKPPRRVSGDPRPPARRSRCG